MNDTEELVIKIPKVFYEYCKAQEVVIEMQLEIKNDGTVILNELATKPRGDKE